MGIESSTQGDAYLGEPGMIYEGFLPHSQGEEAQTLSQTFPGYEKQFFANAATSDLTRLIPQTPRDDEVLIMSCLSYLKSLRSRGHGIGSLRGVIAEVAVKISLDQVLSDDRRYVRAEDAYVRGNRRISRIHDRLMGYMYSEEVSKSNGSKVWASRKEYDGLIFVRDMYGSYRPVVLEIKTSHKEYGEFNGSMRPGMVEKKLEYISTVIDGDFGYGVITTPENVTDRSPLQAHFTRAGGFVVPLPYSRQELIDCEKRVHQLISPVS